MKQAIVEMETEIAPEMLKVIRDAGLTLVCAVIGSKQLGKIAFIVEGDMLPRECEECSWFVDMIITVETYGGQKMHKISEIRPRVAA